MSGVSIPSCGTTVNIPSTPVGRLAPSPTGAQHIGNARTYLLAWLSMRSRGGRLILRLEDIDSPRVKAGAGAQALDDLRWLGLDWDEGPDQGGPAGPYVQTQRLPRYQDALDQLRATEQIYPCTCSRQDVEVAASAPHASHEGPIYPRTCAQRSVADAEGLADRPFAWRFRSTSRPVDFDDGVAGRQCCHVAAELGDFVVAKADGSPSYQLAVVVDDQAMGVTEVLRGDDLIPSAFRQLELYRSFDWLPPRFIHVPLVVGQDGRRLAKRHGDTRLALLRERSVPPERLIGLLAWSCGLRPKPEPCQPHELLDSFNLSLLSRSPFVFTPSMLSQLLD